MKRSIQFSILLIIAILLIMGCGGKTKMPPPLRAPEIITSPSGLQFQDFYQIRFDVPGTGDIVTVQYQGMLENGTVFVDHFATNQTVEFEVGTGQVIPGLDEGIESMSLESRRRLIIPPHLAYGSQGNPALSIPPNATLVYYVTLLEIDPMTENQFGIRYRDLVKGSDFWPEAGDTIVMHYTGWLTDGMMFETSKGGAPLEFRFGIDEVPVEGWQKSLGNMLMGGKRRVVIPPQLGFGDKGKPPHVPAYATLIYEIELLDIRKHEAEWVDVVPGLRMRDVEEGTGAEATGGKRLTVHYTGRLTDGTEFDTSIGREEFRFILGEGQVIQGWDMGLVGMRVGGMRQLEIAPELAYGDEGAPPMIPPNATLLFDIELYDVTDP